MEGSDVDGGVARHQAGVIAAQKVGTFLPIGLAYQTRKIYIIVFVEGLIIIKQQVKYNQTLAMAMASKTSIVALIKFFIEMIQM